MIEELLRMSGLDPADLDKFKTDLADIAQLKNEIYAVRLEVAELAGIARKNAETISEIKEGLDRNGFLEP